MLCICVRVASTICSGHPSARAAAAIFSMTCSLFFSLFLAVSMRQVDIASKAALAVLPDLETQPLKISLVILTRFLVLQPCADRRAVGPCSRPGQFRSVRERPAGRQFQLRRQRDQRLRPKRKFGGHEPKGLDEPLRARARIPATRNTS